MHTTKGLDFCFKMPALSRIYDEKLNVLLFVKLTNLPLIIGLSLEDMSREKSTINALHNIGISMSSNLI